MLFNKYHINTVFHNIFQRKKSIATNTSFYFSLLLMSIFSLSSCKSTRKIQATSLTKVTPTFLLNKIRENELNAGWFAAKIKVAQYDSEKSNSFTANIRMRHDSLLWASISPLLGIVAARVLITKDSVKVIDMLNKKINVNDFNMIHEFIPYHIDFALMEKILLGNMIFINENALTLTVQDTLYILTTEDAQINNTFFINSNFEVVSNRMTDKINSNEIQIEFSDYKKTGDKLFAYHRKMTISTDKKNFVELEFEKIKLNEPTDFPFTTR